jgi:hypothetical protein
LRHEGACRLLADGVDVRTIQLLLGHASLTQTQRYLNLTDEELRRAMEVSWDRKRRLRLLTARNEGSEAPNEARDASLAEPSDARDNTTESLGR